MLNALPADLQDSGMRLTAGTRRTKSVYKVSNFVSISIHNRPDMAASNTGHRETASVLLLNGIELRT